MEKGAVGWDPEVDCPKETLLFFKVSFNDCIKEPLVDGGNGCFVQGGLPIRGGLEIGRRHWIADALSDHPLGMIYQVSRTRSVVRASGMWNGSKAYPVTVGPRRSRLVKRYRRHNAALKLVLYTSVKLSLRG